MIYDLLAASMIAHDFPLGALAGTIALSISAAPIGTFLMLRRMSLAGDAISHAILPGAAAAYSLSGLSLLPMMFGGLAAGLLVALAAGFTSRLTEHKEDTIFAAFFLISLALGVVLISWAGQSEDLLHILFGNASTLNETGLAAIGIASATTVAGMALIWRPLVAESLDPQFLRSVSRSGAVAHFAFLVLFVLNLVAAFQAMGTLLAVGLAILPAAAARFWMNSVTGIAWLAAVIGCSSSVAGLLMGYHFNVEIGPAIILVAGLVFVTSLVFAPRGFSIARRRGHRHRTG